MDTEAQRGHIFISDLNHKYHLYQEAEFTLRKKKICSMADQGPKKDSIQLPAGINKSHRAWPSFPDCQLSLLKNSTFKDMPLPQPQEDQMGYGRYKVKTFGRWITHRRGRKPLEMYPAYKKKRKCISKHFMETS